MASSADITVKAATETVQDLAERDVDSVDSDVRYMAYGARLRTALRAATRYVAYVSISDLTISTRSNIFTVNL
jgi:fission process protein 1